MSEFLYEVGDEYEGSPILASKFLSEVMAVGGLVEIDGSIVRIIYLPASVHGKEEIIEKYQEPVVEAVEEVVETPEPVIEDDDIARLEDDGAPVPVVDAPKPAAKRGRPRKVTTEE